jgi:hypothetical protein
LEGWRMPASIRTANRIRERSVRCNFVVCELTALEGTTGAASAASRDARCALRILMNGMEGWHGLIGN